MIETSTNQTNATTGYHQARRFKSFKRKNLPPKAPKKNDSEILWFHDLSGNKFNYNAKIANKLGLWAAVILEMIRFWCSYNAHKKQNWDDYFFYKTGEEFAKMLGMSEKTFWKVMGILKKQGLIEISKDTNHYGKINIYTLTQKYFEMAGISTITKLEKSILFSKKKEVILNQNSDPNLSETIKGQFHQVMDFFGENLYYRSTEPVNPKHFKHTTLLIINFDFHNYLHNYALQRARNDLVRPSECLHCPSSFYYARAKAIADVVRRLFQGIRKRLLFTICVR